MRHTRHSLVIHPLRLFVYAQAFRFSSGHGRCFSPGFKALLLWLSLQLGVGLGLRGRVRWWRVWMRQD